MEAGSELARCFAAGFSAVDAPASGTFRPGAAGGIATAFMGPAKPRIATPDGTIEAPTETHEAAALDEPAVLSALDVERLADPLLEGCAWGELALD